MKLSLPRWLEVEPWLEKAEAGSDRHVKSALRSNSPGVADLIKLLSASDGVSLETMACRAQAITRRHFGRTVSLYVPLYVSNYCPGGCAYCGFASDRPQTRKRLESAALLEELEAIRDCGFDDVLLLTGERAKEADFEYLLGCVSAASGLFHKVTVESFAMTVEEYRTLGQAGCTGITLYQETYDEERYNNLHRWGPKRDYMFRLEAPARALEAGLRTVGLGVLLGLGDPLHDAACLFQHVQHLRKTYWRAGVLVSFPRIRDQRGGFRPLKVITERLLARMIYAFRICLPDVPLVLSTRERAEFRDGMAGVGISRMSVASRTTVGGYHEHEETRDGQFSVADTRDVKSFCEALKRKGLDPVFKNWDSVFR